MEFVDTHCHLFLSEFETDRSGVIEEALIVGVKSLLLPNIDSTSLTSLIDLCQIYPDICYPMAGLHPTSVDESFENQLNEIRKQFNQIPFKAIGEIGLDLYWKKKYIKQQEKALIEQISLAREFDLPLVIHCREAFHILIELLQNQKSIIPYKGVFHCFTGNLQEANVVIDLGFKLGIGGVVTFKNAGLQETVKNISIEDMVLETDAPYLSPVPHRGKRNQPSYIPIIAKKIAELKEITVEEVALVTTKVSKELFNVK